MYTRPPHFNYVEVNVFGFLAGVSRSISQVNLYYSSSVLNDWRFSAFLLKQNDVEFQVITVKARETTLYA